jgi:hypothetical protein
VHFVDLQELGRHARDDLLDVAEADVLLGDQKLVEGQVRMVDVARRIVADQGAQELRRVAGFGRGRFTLARQPHAQLVVLAHQPFVFGAQRRGVRFACGVGGVLRSPRRAPQLFDLAFEGLVFLAQVVEELRRTSTGARSAGVGEPRDLLFELFVVLLQALDQSRHPTRRFGGRGLEFVALFLEFVAQTAHGVGLFEQLRFGASRRREIGAGAVELTFRRTGALFEVRETPRGVFVGRQNFVEFGRGRAEFDLQVLGALAHDGEFVVGEPRLHTLGVGLLALLDLVFEALDALFELAIVALEFLERVRRRRAGPRSFDLAPQPFDFDRELFLFRRVELFEALQLGARFEKLRVRRRREQSGRQRGAPERVENGRVRTERLFVRLEFDRHHVFGRRITDLDGAADHLGRAFDALAVDVGAVHRSQIVDHQSADQPRVQARDVFACDDHVARAVFVPAADHDDVTLHLQAFVDRPVLRIDVESEHVSHAVIGLMARAGALPSAGRGV